MDWASDMYSDMDPDLMPPMEPRFLEDEDYLDGYYGDEEDPEYAYAYEKYQQYLEDEDMYYSRISVTELLDQCVFPTIGQAVSTVYPLLGLCFFTRITIHFCAESEAQ